MGLGNKKKKIPKFNQIWCVSYLHQWHMQLHNSLGPCDPLGPWGGAKRSNIIKSQSQSQFQRFLSQTLCVFSQMKGIKQRGFSFHRLGHDPGVGLRGTVGGWGSKKKFPKFSQIWCVSYIHEWHMQRHNFLGPRLLGP